MIRRESRQTCTHNTTDIAIQATDETSSSDKEKEKDEEVYDFREPFLFSDMVLLVEDERLHCHRAILSLYSPVFKAMFQSRFEETSSNQVSLPKDDAETVRELLRHLYTPGGCDMDREVIPLGELGSGHIIYWVKESSQKSKRERKEGVPLFKDVSTLLQFPSLPLGQGAAAQRLLPLIHRFQIDSLITTAERTMTFSMTDSLAPKMLALADMYQLSHLKQAAIDACTRLDMKRMSEALEETPLSAELKAIIFEKRVLLLEKAITDIERSFSQSCIRMESKLERVFTNHCQIHSKPLSTTTVPVSIQLTNAPTGDTDRLLIRPVEANAQDSTSTANVRLTTRVLQSNASDVDIPRSSELVDITPGSSSGVATALVEVPAVCENCVERISTHIKDLCRRALHKAQFVPYKPTVITSTSSA
ncbi:unnamed protein product [Taenia asiatica]|uniref:BTB domain-containing protein n=1 Tax=Taenia asiatica TaxID=60517 RepID=A0A0R3WDA5_TAEAS|nr:unnamed protein product [Taenia asiatica]